MNKQQIQQDQNEITIKQVLTAIKNYSHQLYLIQHHEKYPKDSIMKHLKRCTKDLRHNIRKIKINKISSDYYTCRYCNNRFVPVRKNQKYCNIICSQEWYKKQQKLKKVKKISRV